MTNERVIQFRIAFIIILLEQLSLLEWLLHILHSIPSDTKNMEIFTAINKYGVIESEQKIPFHLRDKLHNSYIFRNFLK